MSINDWVGDYQPTITTQPSIFTTPPPVFVNPYGVSSTPSWATPTVSTGSNWSFTPIEPVEDSKDLDDDDEDDQFEDLDDDDEDDQFEAAARRLQELAKNSPDKAFASELLDIAVSLLLPRREPETDEDE